MPSSTGPRPHVRPPEDGAEVTGADLDRARMQVGTRLRGSDLRGAATEALPWRALELTGVRLDVGQAVQVAQAHGALVEG